MGAASFGIQQVRHTRRTSELRVRVLEVTHVADKALNGDVLVVHVAPTLGVDTGRANQDVGVGRQAWREPKEEEEEEEREIIKGSEEEGGRSKEQRRR